MDVLENWTQPMGTAPLMFIAAGAVALLLFLIIKFKMHAFVALILVSLLTAFVTGIPAGSITDVLLAGFGDTIASVGLLVGLGVMLGRLVEVSGGAQALADSLMRLFGEKRAPLALGVASLIFGFPVFLDAALVVMLPVIFAVARRLGGGILLYALPAAGAFSVMHVFLVPHPGPVAAASLLDANVGLLVLAGLIVALPTWVVAGYIFGQVSGRKNIRPVPEFISGGPQQEHDEHPPHAGVVVAMLLLPILLITMNTVLNTLATSGVLNGDATWVGVLQTLGATPIALLISVLVASVVLGTRRGRSRSTIEKLLDGSLGPICAIILITGAGGMFGGVLVASGIGDALAGSLENIGMPIMIAGFVISTIIRVAQGSATVALTTSAALMQPLVAAGDYNAMQVVAIVLALSAGSVMLSHVNDSGFWLVGKFLELDVKTTLKTWTVMETIIGFVGFLLSWAIFGVASA
ncbi:GntP family permease [Arthrobacter castelli]|uniref:GntP family permease n=1 Tax=Arthrobacter castelli TaxID=271431 RepID=UPI00041E05FE|nr:GntP family permease [Arthrobacter castelli]